MASKDVTSSFGSIGLLLPLILIFLIGASSALGCPGHTTRSAYRTKAINTRTVSFYAPTVITYRSPASYGDCARSTYGTRGVRYVSVRDNGYHNDRIRYVAVRTVVPRSRYIAVRHVYLDDAPRYVAVRQHPRYVDDEGTRYVAVRDRAPRTRYVAVRNIDYDDDYDAPRYVAVRRYPMYDTGIRYVATRDADYDVSRARYVAVRRVNSGCGCAPVLQSRLDEVEPVSPTHVVIKTDYLAGTEEVIAPSTSYDDTAYIAPTIDDDNTVGDVAYTRATYSDGNGEGFIAAGPHVGHTTEAVATGNINYVPVSDTDDFDDQAFLDRDGTTFVAADDIEDACLSPVVLRSSPALISTRAVGYVPIEDVDVDSVEADSDVTYVAVEDASPPIRYASSVEEKDVDQDMTYIAVDNDAVGADTVSYVPVEDVTYVPIDTIRYVPGDSIREVDVRSIAADECATIVAASDAESVDSNDVPTVLVGDQQIATNSYDDETADADEVVGRDLNLDGDRTEFEPVVGSV